MLSGASWSIARSHNRTITHFLEFPAVLFGPAFDDYFLVGIELDGVTALTVEIAEEAVLPSAEGEIGHGCGDSDVDPNITGGSFVAETPRSRATRGEQRRLVAVGAALEEREGFVHVIGMDETQYRTEDFRVGEIAARRNIVQNCGVYKVSGLVLRDLRVAAVEQNLRALLFAKPDQRFHALFALPRYDRAHLDIFIKAIADL